jgi:hypothetical protein
VHPALEIVGTLIFAYVFQTGKYCFKNVAKIFAKFFAKVIPLPLSTNIN